MGGEQQNVINFGFKAQFNLGDKTEIMSLLFTNDGGKTYYNEETPRQASEVLGIRQCGLQVMNVNKTKKIIEWIQRRLLCVSVENSLLNIGSYKFEAPKGILELVKVVELGDTLIDLGPQFVKAIEHCGGGFAALNDIGIDFKGTTLEYLGEINFMDILDEWFQNTIGSSIGNFILLQRICATDDMSIAELWADKFIDSCEFLKGLGPIDLWAVGGQIGEVSFDLFLFSRIMVVGLCAGPS